MTLSRLVSLTEFSAVPAWNPYALADKGADARLIQDYLGHRDLRHTARYTRTAVQRFEGLWE